MSGEVLLVSPFPPDPGADHAGGQFLARYVAQRRDLADVLVLPPPPGRGRLAGLTRPFPFTAAELAAWWERAAPDSEDVLSVELHFPHALPLAPLVRQPVVYFVHDVYWQNLDRRLALEAGGLRGAVGRRVRVAAARRQERRWVAECDGLVAFAEKDLVTLGRDGLVVAPPVPWPAEPAAPRSPVVLFTGAMWRVENADAAAWFVREVWPLVRVTGARVVLAGARPRPEVEALAAPDVAVTGWVDDLAATYARASVLVAPLRSGAGVKFKVAEALAAGVPVVATPLAAEGYADAPLAAVTDDPAAFAAAVTRCLSDDGYRRGLAAAGRAWVAGRFDFARDVAAVEALHDRLWT